MEEGHKGGFRVFTVFYSLHLGGGKIAALYYLLNCASCLCTFLYTCIWFTSQIKMFMQTYKANILETGWDKTKDNKKYK